MGDLEFGGFSQRDALTQKFVRAVNATILTGDKYHKIETGIEYRFGSAAKEVHHWLYRSLGPTTDLLRYFPDSLYFDLHHFQPEWAAESAAEEGTPQGSGAIGHFVFFVEYKFSRTKRKRPLAEHPDVPVEYIGIMEREAWLTYQRFTTPNPSLGLYLDGKFPRIALFYAAEYAPEKLFAAWENSIEPLQVVKKVARPLSRTLHTKGSGTPWINFDLRQLKPLERFLHEDLFWDEQDAIDTVAQCKKRLFA